MIRVGLGCDLHRLAEGRPLLLGGVRVPFAKGEEGHSDGDVLLHALTDALLGAAGEGDIGELFPPSDPKWKDADSRDLLRAAWQRVFARGWKIVNIDCVVSIEKPKLLPFREAIRDSIASVLRIDRSQVFVKAKTAEGLGEVGRGRAALAQAVVLLEKAGAV